MPAPDLSGKICLVAGASRGVGRGIARALGEGGATVIVTARSSETGPRTEMRSEAIEDTAREVDLAGGRGHHYICDHRSERAVDEMVHWVLRRFGRIDVAACAVWSGNEGFDGTRYADGSTWGTPFWRRSAEPYLALMQAGALPALLLARAVAPAMVAARSGVLALVTFGADDSYLEDVFYDSAKAAEARLAFAFGRELADHGVTALGLSPGSVATERAREIERDEPDSETPLYAGRALAALVADPDVAALSGRVLHVGDLARHYGFTDADGSQPARMRLQV